MIDLATDVVILDIVQMFIFLWGEAVFWFYLKSIKRKSWLSDFESMVGGGSDSSSSNVKLRDNRIIFMFVSFGGSWCYY